MMKEAERWLSQGRNDLEAAKWNAEGKFFAQACFLSQQAAEKALKENNSFNSILSFCAELDKHYIPSRYPNGLPDSTPSEVYLKQDAQASINNSQKILEFISQLIKI
jgi:HEPN domain-containing protein